MEKLYIKSRRLHSFPWISCNSASIVWPPPHNFKLTSDTIKQQTTLFHSSSFFGRNASSYHSTASSNPPQLGNSAPAVSDSDHIPGLRTGSHQTLDLGSKTPSASQPLSSSRQDTFARKPLFHPKRSSILIQNQTMITGNSVDSMLTYHS